MVSSLVGSGISAFDFSLRSGFAFFLGLPLGLGAELDFLGLSGGDSRFRLVGCFDGPASAGDSFLFSNSNDSGWFEVGVFVKTSAT